MKTQVIVIVAGVFAMIYFVFGDALFRSDEIALFCALCCSLCCCLTFAAFASKKKDDPRVARLIETDDLNTPLHAVALMALLLKPDGAETQEIFEAAMTRAKTPRAQRSSSSSSGNSSLWK